jgi:hypothetical protein
MISFRRTAAAFAVVIGTIAAAEIGEGKRVFVIQTPNGGEPAEARIGSDGTIHLIYNSPSERIPYYVKSTNHGETFSSPIAVVDKSSRKPGLTFSAAAMAVGQRGAVYVAMMTDNWKLKLPGVPEGMVLAELSPGAHEFAPVRSLNGKPSEGFSLAADENSNVAATWLAGKLYANFSHDGGRTFTANAEINSAWNPCDCCTTRAAYNQHGDLAILYREETNDERDIYVAILKKDGRQVRNRVSSTLWKINACPMTYYSLAATRDGYVAAWPTRGEIYFARLDSDGKVKSPGEIKTPGRTGMRTGVVALGAPDGTSLVAWKHQDLLHWQLYDSAGRPEEAPESVSSAGKGAAGVLDQNGKFILFQ